MTLKRSDGSYSLLFKHPSCLATDFDYTTSLQVETRLFKQHELIKSQNDQLAMKTQSNVLFEQKEKYAVKDNKLRLFPQCCHLSHRLITLKLNEKHILLVNV